MGEIKGKWWVLKMTFYNRRGWVTEYGEQRNLKPKTRKEFDDMAKETMRSYKLDGHRFCHTISRARKPRS